MTAQFNEAFEYLMGKECDPKAPGRVNTDGGGRTRYGIAERYWGHVLPENYYTTMSDEDARAFAKSFYRTHFWNPMLLVNIQQQFVASYILSIAVNCGISQVFTWMQHGLGILADGLPGPESLATINQAPAKSIAVLYQAAYAFYDTRPVSERDGLLNRAKG